MTGSQASFLDRSGAAPDPIALWPAVVIPKERIDGEIERLASVPKPQNGRRRALIAHPLASKGNGLAPGIQVALEVLKPGERCLVTRQNSTQVNFCIAGAGVSIVKGKRIAFRQYDVWNTPSMHPYFHLNDTGGLQVRLTYSNAALLEMLNVHFVEESPTLLEAVAKDEVSDDPRRQSPYGTFQLSDDGAMLMPYERLINPPAVESKALHWPWEQVKAELDKLVALGKDYVGRRLYLLY
ncbi:MAG TPA: hypothetical protein VGZ72_22150, partial [Stellaceae bacterium]|nr:hypothetical protein [Stellaceae bacterium]